MSDDKFQFPTLADFQYAARALAPAIRRTPVLESQRFPKLFFKCESLQVTGSFKIRTAYNQLRVAEGARERGVVTSSSGNFAQGVAQAASRLGIDAIVVMMERSNPLKVERTRELGARVVFCSNTLEARNQMVAEIAARENRVVVHPFDRAAAIIGNGTISLEILEQLPAVQSIATPISGGGLLAGVALAARLNRPGIRIVGVQPEGSNATALSFRKRCRTAIPEAVTIADGLLVTIPGEKTFQVISSQVDDVVTVSESAIREATRHFLQRERLVVEPSGAVPLAAVMEGKLPVDGTVLVLSGGNIAPGLMAELS